ncbi:MAG: Stp1/IreP family PP2C-type Ser/Thr phosphatase [Clostridium sp.]
MVGMISDVGNFRKLNEDFIGCIEEENYRFYIVADGMGGHNAGEVASSMAVQTISEVISSNKDQNDMDYILKKAIEITNEKIYKLSQEKNALNGMGTTLTLCLIKNNMMKVANIGDSSCFILKNLEVEKITKDHSLVQELIDSGSITEEQGKNHPNKNIITRALGTKNEVETDIFEVDLNPVNKIILCTDGMSNSVSREEMRGILLSINDNQEACEKLIELSKLNGSKDNISVIVFEGVCGNEGNYTRD